MSDPSVAKMTLEQWVFEYIGLSEREEAAMKAQVQRDRLMLVSLRNTLIMTLGLNINGEKSERELAEDVKTYGKEEAAFAPPRFVPASFLWAQPEVLKMYLKLGKDHDAEEKSLVDDDFDRFSQDLLAKLTGKQSSLPDDTLRMLEAKPVTRVELPPGVRVKRAVTLIEPDDLGEDAP